MLFSVAKKRSLLQNFFRQKYNSFKNNEVYLLVPVIETASAKTLVFIRNMTKNKVVNEIYVGYDGCFLFIED